MLKTRRLSEPIVKTVIQPSKKYVYLDMLLPPFSRCTFSSLSYQSFSSTSFSLLLAPLHTNMYAFFFLFHVLLRLLFSFSFTSFTHFFFPPFYGQISPFFPFLLHHSRSPIFFPSLHRYENIFKDLRIPQEAVHSFNTWHFPRTTYSPYVFDNDS